MAGRSISIQLGGKERELRYDLNAISVIGERLNLKGRLNDLAADMLNTELPLSGLRTILWAGLIWKEPDLTEHEVGSWVDLDNFQEVWGSFFALFRGRLSGNASSPKTPTPDESETSDSPSSSSSPTAPSN